MTSNEWLGNRWLAERQPSPGDVLDLIGLADRDLAASQLAGLAADWRMMIAYNAALQVAAAALAASGFRVADEAHHFRLIGSLRFTLGTPAPLLTRLEGFRKRRNSSVYQRANTVTEKEALEMFAVARELRAAFDVWLKQQHPELAAALAALG